CPHPAISYPTSDPSWIFAPSGMLAPPRPLLPADEALGPPRRHAATILEIIAALLHDGYESIVILRHDDCTDAFDRLRERLERFCPVIVEALDLVIQLRTFLRHAACDIELCVERRTRHARKLRRGLATPGQRREECNVECVRKPEYVGDQPVMLVEAHDHLLRHRGREQLTRPAERLGAAQIHENDVTAGQQLGVG